MPQNRHVTTTCFSRVAARVLGSVLMRATQQLQDENQVLNETVCQQNNMIKDKRKVAMYLLNETTRYWHSTYI